MRILGERAPKLNTVLESNPMNVKPIVELDGGRLIVRHGISSLPISKIPVLTFWLTKSIMLPQVIGILSVKSSATNFPSEVSKTTLVTILMC